MTEWTPQTLYDHFDVRFKDAERALKVARQGIEYRLKGMNEFREALSDQNRTFLPRQEAEKQFAALVQQLNEHSSRLSAAEGRRSGMHTGWGIFMGLAVLAVAIFAALAGGG